MTAAEVLLTLADGVDKTIELVEVPPDGDVGEFLSTMDLAIKFGRRDLLFKFRAMAEGWSPQRIVREMF